MTQVPTPRRRRLTRLALGLSLALNVMILGALGGAMWRHGGPGPRGDGHLPSGRARLDDLDQVLVGKGGRKADDRQGHAIHIGGQPPRHIARDQVR